MIRMENAHFLRFHPLASGVVDHSTTLTYSSMQEVYHQNAIAC